MADGANAYAQAINNALTSAKSMLGKNEVPNRQELLSYLHDGGQDLDPHKVAWCAAFVSASLQKAGLPVPTQVVKDSAFGPGAYAPNYLSYGSSVDPKNIQAGDIIVANSGHHVGFAEGPVRQGPNGPEVQMIAGNEADTSGQYAPGSYTSPTGAVANRAQVGQVGERWVPLSEYSARRYEAPDTSQSASAAPTTTNAAPVAATPTPTTMGKTLNSSAIIDTLSKNIAGIESGGQKNPYETLQSKTGAVGKYQVMPFNVGPWTQQAIGRAETPDEFRKDAAAQEAVFRDQASRALTTMSPQDFASTWFTGKPYSQATAGASDYTGTTNRNYVMRATQGIDNAGTFTPTAVASAANATAPPGATAAAGGGAGPLPGFPGQKASDQFTQGLSTLDKAMGGSGQPADGQGGGQGGGQRAKIEPSPMIPAPGARGVGPGGGQLLDMPQVYGQTINSLADPQTWAAAHPGIQWGATPPGASPIPSMQPGQAPQLASAAPIGAGLNAMQQLQMLAQQQQDPFGGFGYG